MPISIVANDTRLEGRTPLSTPSFMRLDVNEGTPLEYFFDRCSSISDVQGGISTLYIMAHDAETSFAGSSIGGNGIVFCKELVNFRNVDRFELLADKVKHIVLLICSAAATPFDMHLIDVADPELSRTFHGDGDELCRQMAIHSKAKVTVARETQSYMAEEYCTTFAGFEVYCEGDTVDFGEWEGTIVQYGANGRILAEWTNPREWRDSHGVIHDPRLEPRT